MRLAITHLFNFSGNEMCSICKEAYYPYGYYCLTKNNGATEDEFICLDCGKKHDSVLTEMLEKYTRKTEELKEKLLRAYSNKEPKKFFQIDVWRQDGPDDLFTADEDGLVISGQIVHELRKSDWPLRVYIYEYGDLKDVMKGLDKVKKWVQESMDNREDLFEEKDMFLPQNQNIDTPF